MDSRTVKLVYCNCTYAKVVPEDTKREVLAQLAAAGVEFDAVADLCDMSARKDPALKRYVDAGDLRIAACFPRAVRWLFHAAGASLDPDKVQVLNMREDDADAIVPLMLRGQTCEAGVES